MSRKKDKPKSLMDFMREGASDVGLTVKESKSSHRTVRSHEDHAAEKIGGKRHAGSGAMVGLKSDCSSVEYQLEAKQTEHDSISLKLEWLKKITVEAMGKGKQPVMHIRFLNAPPGVDKDWMIISDREFERLRKGQ